MYETILAYGLLVASDGGINRFCLPIPSKQSKAYKLTATSCGNELSSYEEFEFHEMTRDDLSECICTTCLRWTEPTIGQVCQLSAITGAAHTIVHVEADDNPVTGDGGWAKIHAEWARDAIGVWHRRLKPPVFSGETS